MAAEAIYAVKEAEEKGRERVRQAGAEAQRLLAEARSDAAQRRDAVLQQAQRERTERVDAALREAQQRCDEIAAQGAAERERILSPDSAKLDTAVRLVTERIVNV